MRAATACEGDGVRGNEGGGMRVGRATACGRRHRRREVGKREGKGKDTALRRRRREVVEGKGKGEGAVLCRRTVMVVARCVGDEGRTRTRVWRGVIVLYIVVA